jgi:hypothetical protein
MNDAEACEGMAQLRKGKPDEVTWLREACERGRGAACATLIDRGVELPVPPDIKKRLYQDACDRKVAGACTARSRPRRATAPPGRPAPGSPRRRPT